MCAQKRTEIIQTKLKLDKTAGKLPLQKVFNGGGIPSHLEKNEFLHDLQHASLFCRWVAATALKDLAWASVLQAKERPDLSILTYFWNIAEDVVMEAWLAKAATLGSQHTSLHFDGIRLDRQVAQPSVDEFCQSCARPIREKTGFSVQIRVKEHYNFKTLLGKLDSKETVACPEILLKHGTAFWQACIIWALQNGLALWRPLSLGRPAHVFFARRGCRTYEQVKDSAGLRLFPRLPRRELKPGEKILLHLASGGKPHCVAAEVTADGVVQITDGTERVAVSLADMWRMCSEATDRKYIIYFYVDKRPEKLATDAEDSQYDLLLQTQAAAGEDDDEDLFVQDVDVPDDLNENDVDQNEEEDEDLKSITRAGDALLQSMKTEVETFLAGGLRRKGRVQLAARCPFCPFRSWPKSRKARVLSH